MWHNIAPRFSIETKVGGFVGLGITYYWTKARRHHKMYVHLLFFRLVFAWHRRSNGAPRVPIQGEGIE